MAPSAQRLDYKLDDSVFESQQGQEIFLFSKTSRSALGSTQRPVHLVPKFRSSFQDVKWRGCYSDPYPNKDLSLDIRAPGALCPLYTFVARTGTVPLSL